MLSPDGLSPAGAAAALRLLAAAKPKDSLDEAGAFAATTRAQATVNATGYTEALNAMRGMTTRVADVAGALAAGAKPGDGFLSASAPGAAVAAAARPAAALPAMKAGAARVAFTGAHAAPCVTFAADGTPSEAPCAAGAAEATVAFFDDAALFTDLRAKAGVPLLKSDDDKSPKVLSGAATVALSTQDSQSGKFVCDGEAACGVEIKFPVAPVPLLPATAATTTTAAAAGRRLAATAAAAPTYLCLRFSGSSFTPGTGAPGAAWAATPNADGTVTCAADRGGTYMIAAYPRAASTAGPVDDSDFIALQAGEAAFTAPPATRPLGLTLRFVGVDYDALMADGAKRAEFRAELRDAVARRVGLAAAAVQVGVLRRGSVIADVTLHAPETWSADQVRAAAAALLSDPKAVFSEAFLAKWGVTGVEASLAGGYELPAPAGGSAGLTPGAQAGIAIGVIVFAAGVAGGGFLLWRKRRAQGARAQPPAFDNLGGAEAGYVPPRA